MSEPPTYSERLLPGWSVCLVIIACIAMVAIAYGAVLGALAGWVGFLGALVLAAVMVWATAPTIRVTASGLRVGRAALPRNSIADCRPMSAAQVRLARGPQADARTFTCVRLSHARTAIWVDLDDERDPHPAWLVTSSHPLELCRALGFTHVP